MECHELSRVSAKQFLLLKVSYHPHSKANRVPLFIPSKNLTATSFRWDLSDFYFFVRLLVQLKLWELFREITVLMALADINYLFCCSQMIVLNFGATVWPLEFGKGTYFPNLSQSLSLYSRPPYISDHKQYEDLVDACENWIQGSLPC